MAALAMAHGVNANLLRRWVIDAEPRASGKGGSLRPLASGAVPANAAPAFLPLQLAPSAAPADTGESRRLRCASWVEGHRGRSTVAAAGVRSGGGDNRPKRCRSA